MADNQLNVEAREAGGKGGARKLRASGRIPGVCYGSGLEPTPIQLDPRALERLLSHSDAGLNTLIDLAGGTAVAGKKVLVKDLQRDPVNGQLLHADLFAVNLAQKVQVSVPLHVTGKAAGVELGGILDQQLREIDLECLPLAIPRLVEVDVSPLMLGDSLHIRDIDLPEGVTLRSDPDLSIVSVVAPSKAEEEAPEAVEGEEAPEEAAPAEAAAEEKPAEGGEEEKKAGD